VLAFQHSSQPHYFTWFLLLIAMENCSRNNITLCRITRVNNSNKKKGWTELENCLSGNCCWVVSLVLLF
jgi:hypothetical protein